MRATMRITWLLLSLGFLCHSVCSDDGGQNATSVTKDASVTNAPTTVLIGGGTSRTEPTTKNGPTGDTTGATPTPTKPTAAATTPAVTVTATAKPADKTAPTQAQASTVTNSPPATPTSFSGAPATVANSATPAAAITTLPEVTTPAATAASSGGSAVTPDAATIQTPEAAVPSKTSGTEAPVRPPGDPGNVGTTMITKVPTDAPTTGQQSMTHTTINSKTSPENSKGGTGVIVVPSPGQTASGTPEPAGNTATTSTPSTLTKAGPPAAETLGTKAETTSPQATAATITTTTTTTTTAAAAQPRTFLYSLNNGHENEEEKDLVEVCRRLMANLQDGNCTLTWRHHNGKIQFDCVDINGNVKTSLANQYYEEITKKPTDNKTLIAILASCGALLIMIVILAVCASHHRKPYNENQQHLTEELHTVENGYHDNPTLEVMEVQPEMQEKKMALNGEFNNDGWIVPIDNLLKEDIPDEEDTHL